MVMGSNTTQIRMSLELTIVNVTETTAATAIIILFFLRTYYPCKDSVHIKFVRYILQVLLTYKQHFMHNL